MIFTRIRVGKCQTLGNEGKTHVSPPCLTQPPPLKALLSSWGSYCFGSGCGRVVSPCPHTHSTHGWLHNGKRNHCHHSRGRDVLSMTMLNTHALPISRPLCRMFTLTQEGNYCSFSCIGFSWFYPRSSSSTDLRMMWLYPFLMGWFVGSALLLLTHRLGHGNLFLSVVYVCFSSMDLRMMWLYPFLIG